MRLFRDHHHTGLSDASAVAIGNFDGVHLGHQALLDHARTQAGVGPGNGEGGHPAQAVALVTFEPLPRAFFDPDSAPARLSGPAGKLRRVAAQGVDLVWMLRFNGTLAAMPAPDFVERILVRGLGARSVIIGGDFRFGRRREGDVGTLQELGGRHGFTTTVVDPVTVDGERVSSSAIRAALAAGEFRRAEAMLGRPYSIEGHVVRGRQLGRTLGYPTANLRPWKGSTPLTGVIVVQARFGRGPWRNGIASVGVRPAVGAGEPLIEVHLFDFEGDLYGQRMEVRFLERLRDEAHFESLEALVAQMKNDVSRARAILAHRDTAE